MIYRACLLGVLLFSLSVMPASAQQSDACAPTAGGQPEIPSIVPEVTSICDQVDPPKLNLKKIEKLECSEDLKVVGDYGDYQQEYFKELVGKERGEKFAQRFLAQLKGSSSRNSDRLSASKTIRSGTDTFEVHYSKTQEGDDELSDKDLVCRSLKPHVWIKRNSKGDVLQVGASFLEVPATDSVKETKWIEQAVFFFEGKNKGRVLLENW